MAGDSIFDCMIKSHIGSALVDQKSLQYIESASSYTREMHEIFKRLYAVLLVHFGGSIPFLYKDIGTLPGNTFDDSTGGGGGAYNNAGECVTFTLNHSGNDVIHLFDLSQISDYFGNFEEFKINATGVSNQKYKQKINFSNDIMSTNRMLFPSEEDTIDISSAGMGVMLKMYTIASHALQHLWSYNQTGSLDLSHSNFFGNQLFFPHIFTSRPSKSVDALVYKRQAEPNASKAFVVEQIQENSNSSSDEDDNVCNRPAIS
ncbi:MAG: hypothetical protein MUO31_07555 [Thermodesulfovibrionales bacterium]|nr:hypothetical protein [Thermodesulfovibrionales bacterium]